MTIRRREVVTRGMAAVLAMMLLAACGSNSSVQSNQQTSTSIESTVVGNGSGGENTVTVVDSAGRELTIALPVERVAILDRGPADVLRALGAMDRLVGSHESMVGDPFWADYQDIPPVATFSEVSFEAVADVAPQVVISSVRAHGVVTDNELLTAFDIADIKLSLRNPELIRDEVQLVGEVLQTPEEAQRLVDFYEEYETLISERISDVPEQERPRVFVEYHAGDYNTGGPGSRFYEQVVLAGGRNVAVDIDGEVEVSAEWVAEQDPDVIIREASSPAVGYDATSTVEAETLRDEIMSRPVLDTTEAVTKGDVYLLSTDIYSRPGYIVGVVYLAKWLYPDRFSDIDPEHVHRDYLAAFHPGVEYHGVWGYPQPSE